MFMSIKIYIKEIFYRIRKLTMSPVEWAKYLGVSIGNNNLIGKDHWSSEPYLITIGSNCQLTDCHIHTHGGGNIIREQYPDFDMFGKVVIGDWVYIGSGSQIMPGVTIGDHVLVAAGSVVTKSIPAGCIVAGAPAKIIGHTEDYINKNLKWDVRTKDMTPSEKKALLMSLDDSKFVKRPYLVE